MNKRAYSNKQIKSTDESEETRVPVKNKARYFVPEHSRTVEAGSAQEAEKIINKSK